MARKKTDNDATVNIVEVDRSTTEAASWYNAQHAQAIDKWRI